MPDLKPFRNTPTLMLTTQDLFDLSKLENEFLINLFSKFENPLDIIKNFDEIFHDLKGQHIEGTVEKGAHITGPVHIGKGSVVYAGAVIEGPVMIGEHVNIRPHANIRNRTYLGNGCVAGHSADIRHTLALDGAKIQDGTYAGDSLLGFGARIGSGAILANRKFNQQNIKVDLGNGPEDSGLDFMGAILGDQSRLGANVVLSPGTIIGAYTWIGSGVVLSGTVPGDKLVSVKQELDIREKDRVPLKAGDWRT